MGVEAQLISALDVGSGVSRFRRFCSSVGWMDYERIGAGNSDDNLEIGMMSMKRPAPCWVAARWNIRQPMVVQCEQMGTERPVCADEADREFGYTAGISCGYGKVKLVELEKLDLFGKAVCFYHYRARFDHIEVTPKEQKQSVVMQMGGVDFMDVNGCDPETCCALEGDLIEKGRLKEWILFTKGGGERPNLYLYVDPEVADYKTDRFFDVPEAHADAVIEKMQANHKKRNWEILDSTKNTDWEHPIFFSMKDTTAKVTGKKVPRIDPAT